MSTARHEHTTTVIAGILLKSEEASRELYQYYKFGRFESVFPEKLYLLCSHCAHLFFSLWNAGNDNGSGVFQYSPYLQSIAAEPKLEALRYCDYKRRTLDSDSYDRHLRNEPMWFKVWLDVLQKQNRIRSGDDSGFGEKLLGHMNTPGLLDTGIPRKQQVALDKFMKTEMAGYFLQRSILAVEEMASVIITHFKELGNDYVAEQISSLICLLNQIRHTIICNAPAEGPYVLGANRSWGFPSMQARFRHSRRSGLLRVVPKRTGGAVMCAFSWDGGSRPKRYTWARSMAALARSYQEELYGTWAYDTGHSCQKTATDTDGQACWLIQKTELDRIKQLSFMIDSVLEGIQYNPECQGLVSFIRGEQTQWTGSQLAWTCIKTLDETLKSLNVAYREARVLGGSNPGQEVVAKLWPSDESAPKPGQPSVRITVKSSVSTPESQDTEARSRTSQNRMFVYDPEEQRPGEETNHELPAASTGTAGNDTYPTESLPDPIPTPEAISELSPSEAPDPAARADQPSEEPTDTLGPEANEIDWELTIDSENTTQCEGADQGESLSDSPDELRLRQELTQWHNQTGESTNQDALSLKQLMARLGWTQNEVHRMMEQIFGRRPFSVYKRRCRDMTIRSFLDGTHESSCPPEPLDIAVSDQLFCQYIAQEARECATSLANCEHGSASRDPGAQRYAEGNQASNDSNRLLETLCNHHLNPIENVSTPFTLKELEQDLEWKTTRVHRAMTYLFGKKPVTAYKQHCAAGTISDFLESRGRSLLDKSESL